MKAETLAKAKAMLAKILEQGATYREAGRDFGIGRSTVERNVKALVMLAARDLKIPGMDSDAWSSLPRLRKCAAAVMEAVRSYVPSATTRKSPLLSVDDLVAGASRVRARSENANRDVALIYVLFCTGAKPIELARLNVRDYLNPDGTVREHSQMRADASLTGRSRPLYFTSARACAAVDAYLVERTRRRLGAGKSWHYRGLDPDSGLFLTETGDRFEVRSRGPTDPRMTCPLMIATLRTTFKRAGWIGMTAQCARRLVARRLTDKGARDAQVCEVLGLSNPRAVRRLLDRDMQPLEELVRDLV